jgi:hypothetical protein
LSFRRRPESRKINDLDPGLRRGDEQISVSLMAVAVRLMGYLTTTVTTRAQDGCQRVPGIHQTAVKKQRETKL